MKLPIKRLKEKTSGNRLTIKWYRITFFDFIAIFIIGCLGMYLLGEFLGWEKLRGLKIVTPNLMARSIMYGILIMLTIYLLFNRRSVLSIELGQVSFRKRQITGKNWKFSKKKIANIECKIQKVHYENETGNYPDLYNVSVYLRDGKKNYLVSFNDEDSARLKECLKK